ncbi:MAG: 1-acyl-sn-glycerol-3-phosphate acyltransferase [Candidatus Hydrogenedentes bacterium]|nr:1-acyl-sn-glycerol-3-phosphate acyltransferase [Candidatus Hydrogenedentota bacterium]
MSDVFPETMIVVGRLLKWPKRLRIRGAEHCPERGPAAFAGNHMKFDDPPIMFRAIYLASGNRIFPHFLGRDDIFAGAPLSGLIDYNEVLVLANGVLFSRESVRLSQLKPIIKLLREGECFGLYPARTRSRSGAIIEYPEGSEEPGGLSMFVAQAQRGRPGLAIAVVPLARTYNPVSKKTTIVFDAPESLPHDADRDAQREFDCRIVERIASQIEVNVPQVLSAILRLRCIHGRIGPIDTAALEDAVRSVFEGISHPYVDPAAREALRREVRSTVRYLRRKGMLAVKGRTIIPNADAIDAQPPMDYEFRDRNPVKYLTHQIIHLADVTAEAERAALAMAD